MRSFFLLALIVCLALGISQFAEDEAPNDDTVRISAPVEEFKVPDLSERLQDFPAEKVTKDKISKRRLPKPARPTNE